MRQICDLECFLHVGPFSSGEELCSDELVSCETKYVRFLGFLNLSMGKHVTNIP